MNTSNKGISLTQVEKESSFAGYKASLTVIIKKMGVRGVNRYVDEVPLGHGASLMGFLMIHMIVITGQSNNRLTLE